MIVDLSRCDFSLMVSFHKGAYTGMFFCDYGGVVASGDTVQEALDAALEEHGRLCREEAESKEPSDG